MPDFKSVGFLQCHGAQFHMPIIRFSVPNFNVEDDVSLHFDAGTSTFTVKCTVYKFSMTGITATDYNISSKAYGALGYFDVQVNVV